MKYLDKLYEFNDSYNGTKNLKEAERLRDSMVGTLYKDIVINDCIEIRNKLHAISLKDHEIMNSPFQIKCTMIDGYLTHFGIHEKTASLYGIKPENIMNVVLKYTDNQTINKNQYEIWGYYEYEKQRFSLIFNNYAKLTVCFPNNMKTYERDHKGVCIKLEVVKQNEQ